MKRKSTNGLVREDYPQELVDVATRRVIPHITHLQMVDCNIRTLAINCYMQGVRDTAEMIDNKGLLADAVFDNIEVPKEPLEYQI